MVSGKPDSDMQKNEAGPPSYTINKARLKVDRRLVCKTSNHETPGREQAASSLTLVLMAVFRNRLQNARATKAKINKWNYIEPKSFCKAKGATTKRPARKGSLLTRRKYLPIKSDRGRYPEYIKSSHGSIAKHKNRTTLPLKAQRI